MSAIRLIDTHAHLATAQFDADREAALERARAAGVARVLEIGYDLDSSRAAVALAEARPEVYAVVGVQPNYPQAAQGAWLEELRRLAAHPRVVALGEIGLDYYWNAAPPDEQERIFRAQLGLARELGLPVVIHSRDAQVDTVRVLRAAAAGLHGVMHSFSGGWEYAAVCLELGFHLSFSGPVTFPKAAELHEVARRAPLERVLTETDSPYLAPHPHRGRRNEPANVRLVAERLAALRGMALEELAAAVWENACALFRLPETL
ncbi:MAG TPA: TatD family hydrolase [Roseiflexaceae bacterium]|nr:TatD family hydrolase [Roseiflexaceae bacterium]